MRYVFFLVGVLCLIAAPAVWAEDAEPVEATADRVQVIEDDEAGKLRIVIDGNEVGWFDASGFYVKGDIAYTGMISDGLPARDVSDAP